MSTLARTTEALLLVTATGGALAGCVGNGQGDGSAATSPPATVTETATVTATATVTGSPTGSPAARDCGEVAFEPNTDSGAFDIRAYGVDCQLAREVAREADGQDGGPYTAAEGFECRPTGTVGKLPSVVYECTRTAGGTVTFEAS